MNADDLRMMKKTTPQGRTQDLVDIGTIQIEASQDKLRKITMYLDAIKNPYHFRVGETVVHVRFADTATTIQDSVTNVFLRR